MPAPPVDHSGEKLHRKGPPDQGLRKRRPWLLVLLLSIMLAAIVLFGKPGTDGQLDANRVSPIRLQGQANELTGSSPRQNEHGLNLHPAGQSVTLAIDFGQGTTRTFADLPWRQGMTVADLMRGVHRSQPSFKFSQRGSGARAFLTTIGEVANGELANGAKNGDYWLYTINGKQGTRSFGIQPLNPGDRVLWTFGLWE